MDPKPLSTPDITPAQIAAAVAAIVGLLVSQGLLTNDRAQLITGIAAIVLPLIWVAADAVIRHGRSRAFTVPPKGIVAEDHHPAAKTTAAKAQR